MSDIKPVDLRPSEDDNKDMESPAQSSYGQRIRLSGEQLDKVGLKNPQAGDRHDIVGKVHVLSAHVPPDGEKGEEPHVELHITHLGVGPAKEPSLREEIKGAAEKPSMKSAKKK